MFHGEEMNVFWVIIYLLLAVLEAACLVYLRRRVRAGETLPSGRAWLWLFLMDLPVLLCIVGRLCHGRFVGADYLWLMILVLALYLVNMVMYWLHRRDLWLGARLLLILVDLILVGYLVFSPLLPGISYEEQGKGTAYKLYYAAMALLAGQRLAEKMSQKG